MGLGPRSNFDAEYKLGEARLGASRSPKLWKATPRAGEAAGEEVAVRLLPRSKEASDTPHEASMLLMAGGHPNVLRLRGLFLAPSCTRCGAEGSEDLSDEEGTEQEGEFTQCLRQVMVTDYCEGGSLCRSLSLWGAYSSQDAAVLCHDLLQALAHIHSLGIVHRDVQPANVLLKGSGEAVLTGFSLAVGVWNKEELRVRCGAPGYIAPEVILGRGSSSKSDIFSAGCTVCCALSADGSPFQGADMVSTIRNTLTMQPKLTASEGTAFLHGFLKKSPEKRLTIEEAILDPWTLLF